MFPMFLLGVATGMRSMTPIAVVCWFAWSMRLPVAHTWAFWSANIISLVIFGLLAAGEWVGDTLPMAPNRTTFLPAAVRIVFGALCGSIIASAYMEPVAGGIVFGGIGAVVGTWGGFYARRSLAQLLRHDLPVALLGSLVAAVISFAALQHYVKGMNKDPVRYRDATGQSITPRIHTLSQGQQS